MFIQSEREIVEEGTQDRGEKKCYGIDLEIVEDGNRAFAKIENNKYFIKKATSGPESGHFLNPFSIWYDQTCRKNENPRMGKEIIQYQKVNSTCFNLYLRFLETRNLAHYRNAERALIP
jgi:hypothetical protein